MVFVFEERAQETDARQLHELLSFFDRTADVELVAGSEQAEFALASTFAKIWADVEGRREPQDAADPLAELHSVLAATADLRLDSGKLSATRVAKAFGLSVAELAGLLGRSRQAVSKTPSANALQPLLAPYEQIARLRTVLPADDFRRWLNMPNPQLDDHSPIAVARQGQTEVVADLVQDMLSGSTT